MPDRSVATAIHWVTPCRICRVRRLSKACVILSFFLFLSVMYPNQATRICASTFTFRHKISLNSNIVPAYTVYVQYLHFKMQILLSCWLLLLINQNDNSGKLIPYYSSPGKIMRWLHFASYPLVMNLLQIQMHLMSLNFYTGSDLSFSHLLLEYQTPVPQGNVRLPILLLF